MPLTHGVIIEVVSGRDFDAARSELRINVVVGDDGDFPVAEWECNHLPNEVLVTFIVWIYSDGRIAKHRLRTGRCHGDDFLGVKHWVLQMPQMTCFFLLHHL